MTKKSAPIKDFEKTISKLENIVDKLESPQTSLENSLKLFAQGISLARDCEQQLKSAEHKVKILLQQKDGSINEYDFTEEE
jgi:exodeoxyribonuclease VII small subunit